MPNYIIDPQVFYWINTLGSLKVVFGLFGGLFTIVSFGAACAWLYNKSEEGKVNKYDTNKMYAKIFRKLTIMSVVLGSIMIVAAIFIPGKNASVEMLIAKTANFSNIEWSVQQIKEVVDYIVQAIKTI